MLTKHLEQKMKAYIEQYGLEAIEDQIFQYTETCMNIELAEKEDYGQVGNSRIGGVPDLPAEIEWPCDGDEYRSFIAQINLSELPQNAIPELPAQGMLYFFLGLDEPAYNIDHTVYYFEGDCTQLKPAEPPTGKTECSEAYRGFTGYKVTFEPDVFIRPDEEIVSLIEETDEDAYFEMGYENSVLWGKPADFAGDPRVDAYFCKNGMEGLMFNHFKTPKELQEKIQKSLEAGQTEYAQRLQEVVLPQLVEYHKNKAYHQQQMKSWHVLLKVQSLDEVGMCWWDAGLLQFMINKEDLKNKNFNHTYVDLATS